MEVKKLMHKYRKTKSHLLKNIYRKGAKLWSCVIGQNVVIGNNVGFIHNSVGTVIYTDTVIEDHVRIYQNVTLGKSDVLSENATASFIIRKGASSKASL